MANPMCMSDDGNQAVFIGTVLTTGDSVTLCGDCLGGWCGAVIADMIGMPQSAFADVVEQLREVAAQPDEPDADAGGEHVATAAEGAPTDEAPGEQSSDTDAGADDGEQPPGKPARKPRTTA